MRIGRDTVVALDLELADLWGNPLQPQERIRYLHGHDEILPALERSIAWTKKKHAEQFFPIESITHAHALASLERFREVLMESSGPDDFRGRKNVVLYFYPKDRTPGCTMQAIEFSDHERDFEKFDSVVLGVSCDDCITHAEFRDENGLSIRLLADPDGDVCRAYGVWREPTEARRSCIVRSTFIIDKRGKVQHALYGVTPKGHAAEILGLLKTL